MRKRDRRSSRAGRYAFLITDVGLTEQLALAMSPEKTQCAPLAPHYFPGDSVKSRVFT